MHDGQFRVKAMMELVRETHPTVFLDHWHLSIGGGPAECGYFSLLSQRAVNTLWDHLVPLEQGCAAYPTRNSLRCDVCPACRVYDRLDAAVFWLRDMREKFFMDRPAFEARRADLNFDEVLPCGTRLRVSLLDPKKSCFTHNELDIQ